MPAGEKEGLVGGGGGGGGGGGCCVCVCVRVCVCLSVCVVCLVYTCSSVMYHLVNDC